MKEDDSYCGYSCTEKKAKLQEIIDETVDFSKFNPEWGLIMLGKFMEMIYDARLKLNKDQIWQNEEKTILAKLDTKKTQIVSNRNSISCLGAAML